MPKAEHTILVQIRDGNLRLAILRQVELKKEVISDSFQNKTTMKKLLSIIILLASTKCFSQSIDSSYHEFRWNAAHDTIITKEIKEYRVTKAFAISLLQRDSTNAQQRKVNLQNQIIITNSLIRRLGREIKALTIQ